MKMEVEGKAREKGKRGSEEWPMDYSSALVANGEET
jgi:hypothetical protein